MKQTAVEWLQEELKGVYESEYFNLKIKEALEMEKEQIENAYRFGISDEYVIGSQRYYNETFNQQSVTDDTL